jgi:RNase P/RNase MRP subunit p29
MSNRLDLVITELLIGQTITILLLKENLSVTGSVLNETRNTLIVKDQKDNKIKKFPKSDNMLLERMYKNNLIQIKGSLLKGRPEERLKAEPHKKW